MRAETTAAIDPASLTALSGALLEGVACRERTQALTAALDTRLGAWASGEEEAPAARVIVSAPHCATPAALVEWARDRGWTLLDPPTTEEIMSGGEAWIAKLSRSDGANCVLPHLERCFLRHAEGLDLCRRLLAWLPARPGRTLVGCNSWAWAFLGATLGAEAALPVPLALAPFDAAALQRWFTELLNSCPGQATVFRGSASGRLILASNHGAPPIAVGAEPEPSDTFLTHLAAGSRGIAGVAWAIWRHSLRVSTQSTPGEQTRASAGADPATSIWVKPWSELNLPAPPPGTRQSHRFIFQALLIHGGLSADTLDTLLPISGALLRQSLHHLEQEHLIERDGHHWQVTRTAYPAVRQSLINEEFLVGPL